MTVRASPMRSASACLALLGVVLLAAQVGCGHGESGSLGAQYRGAPIILISIDTLRADHLPLYGYRSGSTPVLDRFGRDAIVFDDVYSHSPLTLPSHASMFTGLLPRALGFLYYYLPAATFASVALVYMLWRESLRRWLLWAYVVVAAAGFAAMLPISAAFIETTMATFNRLMIFQNWI